MFFPQEKYLRAMEALLIWIGSLTRKDLELSMVAKGAKNYQVVFTSR